MLTNWITVITEVICSGFCVKNAALYLSPECSGINSVRALLILALILGFTTRMSAIRRFALLACASILAVAQNVLRVSILVYCASRISHSSWELLHLLLGYATGLIAIMLLFVISDKFKE